MQRGDLSGAQDFLLLCGDDTLFCQMIGLQRRAGRLLSGEDSGSLWQDEVDALKGKADASE